MADKAPGFFTTLLGLDASNEPGSGVSGNGKSSKSSAGGSHKGEPNRDVNSMSRSEKKSIERSSKGSYKSGDSSRRNGGRYGRQRSSGLRKI